MKCINYIIVIVLVFSCIDLIWAQNLDTAKVETIIVCDKMPEFPGGNKALLSFINKNIHYPDSAKALKPNGKVFAEFIIDEEGKIVNPKIIKSIEGNYSKLFDDEILRVIKLMPKWTPGSRNGKTEKSVYRLPINFNIK